MWLHPKRLDPRSLECEQSKQSKGYMSTNNEVKQLNPSPCLPAQVYPDVAKAIPVCPERPPLAKSWLGPLKEKPQVPNRRIRMLGYWMKTPEKWAAPNACMNYLGQLRWGKALDPQLAFGYLLALEVWALCQVKKEGWQLREGSFWAWLPVIEEKIYKHLTLAPREGPKHQTQDRERKHKYRYRPTSYENKLLGQLRKVYEKDSLRDFVKRQEARLLNENFSWERLLDLCGMPNEIPLEQYEYVPKPPKNWNEDGTNNEQWNETWLGWKMVNHAAPNPEDGFDVPDESLVKLLFNENKSLAEIAQSLGVSVRTVLNLRKESASEKVQDMIEDWEVYEQSREQTLSIWLYRRLNQIRRDARRAAFHATQPALRE
jgi:hypothetical protein